MGCGCKDLTKLGVYYLDPSIKPLFKATEGSACWDICSSQSHSIEPGSIVMVETGIILDIPNGYSVRLHPRSSLAYKKSLTLANAEGVIDADYVDPVKILLYNIGKTLQFIQSGERICQAELVRNVNFKFNVLTEPPKQKTERNGGFGSTGS